MNKKSPTTTSSAHLFTSAGNLAGRKFSLHSAPAMLAALGACAVWLLATEGKAVEKTWKGGSNNWKNSGSWDSTGVPGDNDLAIFDFSNSAWAGPNGTGVAVQIGAILARGTGAAAQYIQPFNGTTGTSLTLNGYSYDFGGGAVNLLLGNTSDQTLSVGRRNGDTEAFDVILGSSGVIYTSGSQITVGGVISDGGSNFGITKTGDGVLYLDEYASTSTYGGGFVLEEGTIVTYGSSTTSGGGALVSSPFGTGTLTLRGGTIRSTSANPRNFANAVVLDGEVTFGLTGTGTGSGTLNFSSAGGQSTTLASDSTVTTNANVNWYQAISGEHGLTKAGPAYLQIMSGAAATYTGETTVSEGAIWMNGVLTSSPVTVQNGGTFGGLGQVGGDITVEEGGTFAPGSLSTIGTLTTFGSVSLDAGAVFQFDLSSADTFDKLYAGGLVGLGGASLQLTLGFQPVEGNVFVLVENVSGQALDGLLTYAGVTLNDGDTFTVTSGEYTQGFTIDYDYSDGIITDSLAIVATSTAGVPEPSGWLLLGLGSVTLAAFSRRQRARELSGN